MRKITRSVISLDGCNNGVAKYGSSLYETYRKIAFAARYFLKINKTTACV